MEDSTIDIGTQAPDFKLPASNGTEVSLSDYLTKNHVYLFFVREFN